MSPLVFYGIRCGLAAWVVVWGCSFVLLGSKKSRLEVSPEDPVVKFYWTDVPLITALEHYRGGIYLPDDVDLDELTAKPTETKPPYIYDDLEYRKDIWLKIINHAMDHWNNVEGSYLVFELEEREFKGDISRQDRSHVISIASANLGYAGFAAVTLDRHPNGGGLRRLDIIMDCDITLGNGEYGTPAGQLEMALTHELGHCLGLGHPHSSSHAVMSYHRKTSRPPSLYLSDWTLSVSDRAGLIYLYPRDERMLSTCGSLGGSLSVHHHRFISSLSSPLSSHIPSGLLMLLFLTLPGLVLLRPTFE